MRMRLLSAALAVTMVFGSLLSGCASAPASGGNSSNGSIAISHDDALLFAADADLDTLFVIDTKTQATVAKVKVGRQPEKVLVAPDDTVYVTNRMDRSVSVLRPGDTTESARLAVGVEPVGLAMAADGKTLYVVNSTSLTNSEFGTVMAFDTASQTLKWETPVGAEPRGITLLANGKAAITLYKSGDLTMVDVAKGTVLSGGTDLFQQLNRSALAGSGGTRNALSSSTSRPRGMEAIVASAAGDQVFVTSRISSDAILITAAPDTPIGAPTDLGAAGYGAGTCGSTAVTSPGLFTFDSDGNPQVSDISTCATDTSDQPPMILTADVPGMPVQGPKAVVTDPTGSFLYIANFESNNIAIVPTATRPTTSTFGNDVAQPGVFTTGGTVNELISVGAGPTGIAVSHDGKKAYVFNAFDHSVSRLEAQEAGSSRRIVNAGTTRLAEDVLSPDVVAGRKLFFSAVDSRMNSLTTGIACGSCHLEGREDGHVWNFADGPRQTPSLAGRMLSKTAPFHWNGEFNDLMSFMSLTVQRRMGGTGVTPAMERQIAAFLDSQPAADNPYRGTTPTEVVARGRGVFEKAGCNTCHGGEAFTDNSFADVGTFVSGKEVNDVRTMLPHGGLNTPSLLGVARTAPFLHDGSAVNLKARILQGKDGNKHGTTADLTDDEVNDLVSYVKTL